MFVNNYTGNLLQSRSNAHFFLGSVREQTMQKPNLIHVIAPPPSPTASRPIQFTTTTQLPPKSDTALQATTTECPPNHTAATPINKIVNSNNLLKKLANSHYQSYTTALTVTIAVGCFLLLLNILIFAGIYHQRDRTKNKQKKKELSEGGSCSSSSEENYENKNAVYEVHQINYETRKGSRELSRAPSLDHKSASNYVGDYNYEKQSLEVMQLSELPLQQFKSSPPPGVKRAEGHPPSYTSEDQSQNVTSPSIPEPPPPPKNQPPNPGNQIGILRSHGAPTTPGTMKKRVQIQEISV